MEKRATFIVSGAVVAIGELHTFASGFEKREVIVETSKNEAYPSPVTVTFKKAHVKDVETLNVGDGVTIDGFVEGRKWDPQDGRAVKYFVDLSATAVMVTEKAPAQADAETPVVKPDDPTSVTDWKTLLAFGVANGEDEAKVKARCQAYKTAKKLTAKFTVADWQAVAAEIVQTSAQAQASDPDLDDMPF